MSYGLTKKPTKPPSGYNIFYAGESKRTRGRERAELAYFHRVLQRQSTSGSDGSDPSAPTSKNKTKFIGGKWKALRPHSRELFAIRSRDELEVYHVNKMLWGVLDRLLDNAGMSWDDDLAPGGGRRGSSNGKGGGKKNGGGSSGGNTKSKTDNPKPPGFPRELEPRNGGLSDTELQEGLLMFLG